MEKEKHALGESADEYNLNGSNINGGGEGNIIVIGPNNSIEGGKHNDNSDSNVDNSVDNSIITYNNTTNTYTYSGGNKVINDYSEGKIIDLSTDYRGYKVDGANFLINSGDGALTIENARDKYVDYSYNNQNVAYSYVASNGGEINGRDKNNSLYGVMIGAENKDNQIYAGDGGSQLWGGVGGNDVLCGGAGTDEIIFDKGAGNDVVNNVDDNDVVNLGAYTLSDITAASVTEDAVYAEFNDGSSLRVNSSSKVGFRIENATYYVADRASKQWAAK